MMENNCKERDSERESVIFDAFQLSIVKAKSGEENIAVVFLEEYTSENATKIRIHSKNTPETFFEKEISKENTCVLIEHIMTGEEYILTIDSNDVSYHGEIQVALINNEEYELKTTSFMRKIKDAEMVEIQNAVDVMRAASVTYTAYTSAGGILGSYDSMFAAIERARTSGTGATVKKDGIYKLFFSIQLGLLHIVDRGISRYN